MKTLTEMLQGRGILIEEKVDDPDKIDNKEELYDYAEAILKKAHGDKYDKKKSDKMINDLIKKYGVEKSGTIVGIIQNSVSESANDPDMVLMQEIFDNVDSLGILCEQWQDNNAETPQSQDIIYMLESLTAIGDRYAENILRIGALPKVMSVNIVDEDVRNKKLSSLIKRTDEFKELKNQYVQLDETLDTISFESQDIKMLKLLMYNGIEKLISFID